MIMPNTWMYLFTPGGNEHVAGLRMVEAGLKAAGFEVQEVERSELPMGPKLVRPYILGRATVSGI